MKKMFTLSFVFFLIHFGTSYGEMNGDYDRNGKIGLEDSIGILQVVSGIRQDSQWTLYDDFNSGVINSDLWTINDSSRVSIEDGKVKIVHAEGYSWLQFKNPLEIKAVKATVRIASCTGTFRARIVGNNGKDGEGNFFWQGLQIQNTDGINGYAQFYLESASKETWDTAYTFDCEIKNPMEIVNHDFVYELSFDLDVWAKIQGIGTVSFIPEQDILYDDVGSDQYGFRRGMGVSGSGSGVVYFDDIYVKYNSKK